MPQRQNGLSRSGLQSPWWSSASANWADADIRQLAVVKLRQLLAGTVVALPALQYLQQL